jgi:hypothetical protein
MLTAQTDEFVDDIKDPSVCGHNMLKDDEDVKGCHDMEGCVLNEEAANTSPQQSPSCLGSSAKSCPTVSSSESAANAPEPEDCPLQFASRLNSMRERLDLWPGSNDVLGWVERMGTVAGLNLVDFNYPQVCVFLLDGIYSKSKLQGYTEGRDCKMQRERSAGCRRLSCVLSLSRDCFCNVIMSYLSLISSRPHINYGVMPPL